MFDVVPLMDDIAMAQLNKPESLPSQSLGPARDEGILTYQFSVRVCDGCRWSDWSDPTEPFCFAIEPKLAVLDASKAGADLAFVKGPDEHSVVGPAPSPNPPEYWPHPALQDSSAHEEVPLWLSISKVAKRPEDHGSCTKEVESDSLLNHDSVAWPNLPPQAYARPDDAAKNVI
jgi:hypothetical protein